MPNSRIPSPARSQGVISTPRRKQLRRTHSVGSPARTNLRLSSIVESYKVSPVPNRQSVLNDDTDIEMPGRGSWWKKIDDNSRDVLELLQRKELIEVNNVAEEFDVEILSQENKNYTLDLPDSSDGESIGSIIIPHRKLFTQKAHQPQIKFGQIKNNRETLQKLNKSYVDQDKEVNIGRKTLFCHPSKPRTKPVFPAALLNISANKTVNKTKEITAAEVKGQVRSLFGGRPGTKRKNMFADFVVSESDEEIPEIQPKVFGFQKRNEPKRRASSMSRHSPTSSIDLEMEDWILLPSSTMVENQIEEAVSPVKRIKLSNLRETKDESTTNSNNTINKTKSANKSVNSKNKSKNASTIHQEHNKNHEINITPRNASINSSRVTRSMGKSLRENSVTPSNTSKNLNKTKNQTQSHRDRNNESKTGKTSKNVSQSDGDNIQEKQSKLIDQQDPDEDFTLEYDNDDNEVVLEVATSVKNDSRNKKNKSSLNMDVVEDKSNFLKKPSGKISKDNLIEQGKSPNKMCENQEHLLDNKQNNSQEIRNVVGLNRDCTNVQKLNKSITKEKDKNKNKSIRNSVENNENTSGKVIQTEKISQEQSVERNAKLAISSENLNEGKPEDQEIQSENEQSESSNRSDQNPDVESEKNESTQVEENNDSKIVEENESELQENASGNENVTEEKADNEEQEVINEDDTVDREKETTLDDQRNNIEDSNQNTLPNVSHDTTGRHKKKMKSPEVILHDKTKEINSFTVQGRNTSVRKTKSIIFHNKLDTERDFRRSTGFSDATGNSSAEGSGWDSHRTTRKTLRQTFGKDFTPRKSLRALVMEKTAKLQANFNEVVDNIKIPQANSTEYDQVQDELDYQETELVQVEQNIEMVQVHEGTGTIQIEEDQQVDVRNVTEPLEDKDESEQLEGGDEMDQSELEEKEETEQSEESVEMDHSENEERYETTALKESEAMEESEGLERNNTKQFEGRGEVEESEVREEMEESKIREELEESEEREELEGGEMEESEEKEEMEESEEREEMEQSENEERDETDHFEEREELEEREDMEESKEREEMEESKEREEMEESEEKEEMEESEEREEMEQSENEERDETDHFEDREELEEREEMEESKEREEMEQSENEEKDQTEHFQERDEIVPDDEIMDEESDHEVSKRTRQTSLETYLQKIKQDNAEKRRKIHEELRNSLKNPKRDTFNLFKVPQRPVPRTIKIQKPTAKQIKSILPIDMLPSEVIEDMKYKPPKRFQPNNASWITKRLYKFLENKLEPKYDYKARVRAEKLVQCIYIFTKEVRRHDSVRSEGIEELKREMARLDIVKTHFDFYEFCHEFFPREIRIKVVPDIVNNISLPRHGVFSDILR